MREFIFFLAWGCLSVNADCIGKSDSHSDADEDYINMVVAGNTDFALSLYERLREDSDGNMFFSPYTVSTSMAIVYGGARGQTQKQIASALHFTMPADRLADSFGSLQKQLTRKDTRGYQLYPANALWLQKGVPFLQEFLDLTAPFDAGRYHVDFVNESENARKKINGWVEKKTKDKIKSLIPRDGIDKDTDLVITNAIYFKGDWKTPFDKHKTKVSNFFVSAEKKVSVPMMYMEQNFKYYEDDKLQALELPYKGDEISMMLLLPRQREGFRETENILTAELLDAIESKMMMLETNVYIPRFKVTWGTVSLKKVLIALGMADAFNPEKADFSGIIEQSNLFISDVFHKAFVEVDEVGTEAAAATGTVISHSGNTFVFCADHPFLFLIRDNRSGTILFIGRVINPAEQE